MTTASNSSVNIINGGTGCNVFWQIGSSATLGTTTSFIGNILANTSITLNTGATLSGRALALNGAVTLDSNTVSISQCNAVFIAAPTVVKAFGTAAMGVGDTTTLSFTITNPNPAIPLTGVAFTDTLPAGLIVSTPSNGLTGSCGGGTITATPASGSVALSGATLAGGASCTFSVNVTATAAGVYSNSVAVSSTNGGTGNTSTTSITVLPTPPATAPPTIVKAFGAASIGVGGTTTLSFTIRNPNAATALTGVAFTDTLPAGLIVSTPSNGLVGSCGGGTITATPGLGSVTLSGATLAGGASCTFSVNVTGTAAGVYSNSVAVTSTNGGAGNTSTAAVSVVVPGVAPPVISKSFGPVPVSAPGVTTPLTFTIRNPNATVALTGVAFTDTLPAGLIVSTPRVVTGSCGGGTITAVAGSGSISLTGATLAAGASCTFSVNVTVTTTANVTNVTGNVSSSNGGLGNTAVAQLVPSPPECGAFLVRYAANLNIGESYLTIGNDGSNGAPLLGPGLGGASGNICVNVYAFDANEEMISCCSCLVTPDQVRNLGVNRDITSNTATGVTPTSVTVKLLSTLAGPGGSGTSCANSAATVATATAVPGILAWGTTLHPTPLAGTYATTETPFGCATLSQGELASLANRCSGIIGGLSGFGICGGCRPLP